MTKKELFELLNERDLIINNLVKRNHLLEQKLWIVEIKFNEFKDDCKELKFLKEDVKSIKKLKGRNL